MRYLYHTPKGFRNEKRNLIILIIIIILIVSIPLSVIISWLHIYHTKQKLKTPFDYPGSTWISEEPRIELHVSNSSNIPADSECYILYRGEKIPVNFYPGYPTASSFVLRDDPHDIVLSGSGRFFEKEVILKITVDHLFDGQYREITLKRVDMNEVNTD